jgi:hypothetical protein
MENLHLKERRKAVQERVLIRKLERGWNPYSKGRKVLMGISATMLMLVSGTETVGGFVIGAISALTLVSLVQGMAAVDRLAENDD